MADGIDKDGSQIGCTNSILISAMTSALRRRWINLAYGRCSSSWSSFRFLWPGRVTR